MELELKAKMAELLPPEYCVEIRDSIVMSQFSTGTLDKMMRILPQICHLTRELQLANYDALIPIISKEIFERSQKNWDRDEQLLTESEKIKHESYKL